MGNEKNLIPQAHKLTVEEQSAGGKASARSKREKKTVQKILNDFLETSAKDSPQVSKLAAKMGLKSDESVKDLFTIVCILNTLRKGDLGDLEKLTQLLGEKKETVDADVQKQADFLAAVKKAVNNDN